LVTRNDTGSRIEPADWLVRPCIRVPAAGTAGAPAGALSVRSTSGWRYFWQPVRTRAVAAIESAASVPVTDTRYFRLPSLVRPEAVKLTPSAVRPERRITSADDAKPAHRAPATARPLIRPSS
jgi:hypothetical protein